MGVTYRLVVYHSTCRPLSSSPPREQLCNRSCSNKHTHLSTLRFCSDASYADLPLALLGAPVSGSNSSTNRFFGYTLRGTSFASSRTWFNEIGTNLHVLNGCRYQNMICLTRWCQFPLIFFSTHHFFVWNRVVWEWSNNKTIQTMLRLTLVPTTWVQRLLFRVDWSQSTFTHSLYIDHKIYIC